jgi:hypothetical protein
MVLKKSFLLNPFWFLAVASFLYEILTHVVPSSQLPQNAVGFSRRELILHKVVVIALRRNFRSERARKKRT